MTCCTLSGNAIARRGRVVEGLQCQLGEGDSQWEMFLKSCWNGIFALFLFIKDQLGIFSGRSIHRWIVNGDGWICERQFSIRASGGLKDIASQASITPSLLHHALYTLYLTRQLLDTLSVLHVQLTLSLPGANVMLSLHAGRCNNLNRW